MIARGAAVRIATRRALDNPRVRGTCSTRCSVHHARVIITMASSALPMAPAVVPIGLDRTATVARSMMVAARPMPSMGFVFPMAWRVVIRRRLCAEKMIVIASMAKGNAPARREGP